MECIYHGCMYKNSDGINRIIAAGEKCLVSTRKSFQRDSYDVSNHRVKTRPCTKNRPTEDFDDYMLKREWINRWVLGKEEKNNCLELLCLAYSFTLHDNNGNIFTVGTDEREYLQRKYNGM